MSAATIAYSIGPVLHSRPSASFLIPASRSSSRAVAADRHPAGAPSGREIRLRQRRERDDRRLGIERGEGADRTVELQVGVDLVGEQREVVLFGEIDQRAPGVGGIGRAGGIVRIDDDQRPGRRA